MYTKILVAIDASLCHHAVIAHALELARAHKASLSFVYVVEDPTLEVYGRSYGKDLYKDFLKAGSETLDEALKRASAAQVVAEKILVEKEHPAEGILKREAAFDLTILGTHGRSGLKRMMLGSVTEEVVRRSNKPHLIVSCE